LSKVEVNEIDKQSGSTLTIGGSGTTVQLGTGATQSGFGRSGSVNWQTTKKTTAFTAANGEGYFVDTAASGAVTMTLPSSPSAGNIVAVKDYNGNFATANLTIGRNGSPINGANDADPIIKTAGASLVLVYVDASQGWVVTQDDESVFAGEAFVCATGGTESTCGDFKIHTFTGPGTFTVNSVASNASDNIVDYMVVAGGGGAGTTPGNSGGGGGAGGFRFFATTPNNPQSGKPGLPLNGYGSPTPSGTAITVTATGFPIAVGGGGAGGPGPASSPNPAMIGVSGVASTFSTVTSAGGGGGGAGVPSGDSNKNGANGGSGGGGGGGNPNSTGGSGNTPSVTPPQGNNGGGNNCGPASPDHQGSGGGGAIAVGQPTQGSVSGNGGAGAGVVGFGSGNGECSVCVQYFSGGGAAGRTPPTATGFATGGIGGGGDSADPAGQAGTTNTGGGGGAGTQPNGAGGAGGSGIVVIRYKFQ
jgi:hypothetical protein